MRISRSSFSRGSTVSCPPEQMAAVTHVLSSTDGVMAIRGQAGVGKSFLLKSLVNELDRNSIHPVALAPTVSASRGALREAGLADANTLAMFMSDSKDGRALREKAKGSVVVLDEAGLTSTPDMLRLMEKATELNARVLLVGDTGQLSSVERGDALRLLERDGLVPAELKHIRRQTNETYRAVVEEMATGQAAAGLEKARTAGFVTELSIDFDAADEQEAHEEIVDRTAAEQAAKRVAEAYENGHSNIVVAPTHALGRVVTAAIRAELQANGHIGEDEAKMTLLRQVDLRTADRRDAEHALEQGDLVVMRRDDEARGLSMGEVLQARADQQGKVRLYREGVFPTRVTDGLDPRAYGVYRSEEIPIAVGDQVRAFEPMADMARGDRGTIKSIDRWRHTIELTDGRAISMDSKHLGHGYVVTVQGSQGQSVNHAVVVATSSSLGAMSKEAMYVAASRGEEKLDIITDDVAELQGAVCRSVERAHGIDVANEALVRDLPATSKDIASPSADEVGLSHRREQEPELALVGASASADGIPSADDPENKAGFVATDDRITREAHVARSVSAPTPVAEHWPIDDFAHSDEPRSADSRKQEQETAGVDEMMQQMRDSTARTTVSEERLLEVESSTQDARLQSQSIAVDDEIAVDLPTSDIAGDDVPVSRAEIDRVEAEHLAPASIFETETSVSTAEEAVTNAVDLQLECRDTSALQVNSAAMASDDVTAPCTPANRATQDIAAQDAIVAVTDIDTAYKAATQLSQPDSAIVTESAVSAEREVLGTADELRVDNAQRSSIEGPTETTFFIDADYPIASTLDKQDEPEHSDPKFDELDPWQNPASETPLDRDDFAPPRSVDDETKPSLDFGQSEPEFDAPELDAYDELEL